MYILILEEINIEKKKTIYIENKDATWKSRAKQFLNYREQELSKILSDCTFKIE